MSEDTLKESLDEYWKQSAKTKDVVRGIMNLHGHGDSRTSEDQARPYPEGIAWDEAWRQRRRADRLAGVARMLIGCVEDALQYPEMLDDFAEELESARAALENQYGD